MAILDELAVREYAMRWLDRKTHSGQRTVSQPDVASFDFNGQDIALLLRQQGITKPRQLVAALSIRTTYTPPGTKAPYEDAQGPDGFVRYKYQGTDANAYDNRSLRRAGEMQLPLIWFIGVAPGRYLAQYPIFVRADEPAQLQVALALDESQIFVPEPSADGLDTRRYVERLNRLRLHQPVFRAQVLRAYEEQCAVCRLRHHAELLDAAHILADGHPLGHAVVPNGLAMCKIHHAAFDANIIGIRPDLTVAVARNVLAEIDGPMLRYGLQEMAGVRLHIPRSARLHPDPTRLGERFLAFVAAGS